MKSPIIGFSLLTSVVFFLGAQVGTAAERQDSPPEEEVATIQVLNLCVLPSGRVVLKCKNNGSKPVKAFRGKWVVFDDFNEPSQSEEILFTSNTPVTGSNALLGGYLIQPDGIIYLASDGDQRVAMVGRVASETFGNMEDFPPSLKKRFKAVIEKVVFADREDIDNLRKQEEAIREQERLRQQESLRQQEMARRAEDAARQAEQKQRLQEMVKQSETPTRELARIPMSDPRDKFIVTDVYVEYRGTRTYFGKMPNFQPGGSRAIVDGGAYSYFATQADRDKAIRISNEAIKAWQRKFPEAFTGPTRDPETSETAKPSRDAVTQTETLTAQIAATEAALTSVYRALRDRLSPDERVKLKEEELEWIKTKDAFPEDSQERLDSISRRVQELSSRLKQGH